MAQTTPAPDDPQALRYFQLQQLFEQGELDAVLDRPEWAARYPDAIAAWKSADALARSRALLPGEIVRAVARDAAAAGDLHAGDDGETLYWNARGAKPWRFFKDANGKTVVEDIPGTTRLQVEDAIVAYGADAVWLAQEYGQSRRGERDERYRSSPTP